jgi:amidohydrolase
MQQLLDELTQIRQAIHAEPELSGEEYKTQKRIISFLEEKTSAEIQTLAETAVLAKFKAKNSGPVVMLRADTDALPIQEVNTFKYRSKVDGVSHKCGHDGHTSIMLGVAAQLAQDPPQKGEVWLLFQPAEENGRGAQGVLDDPNFDISQVNWVYALHNLPGFKKHQVVIKEGSFTGHVSTAIIKLNGKTAHAAEPEQGNNPATTIAKIVEWGNKNTFNNPAHNDFFLVTPVYITMGELAYGISAGYGEVHLTIRSWRTDLFDEKCAAMIAYINEVCAREHIRPEITWAEEFFANMNNEQAVKSIALAAKASDLEIIESKQPFKWGEDFGLFTQKSKGAMFGLGAGENMPALHNPDYDYPDEITATGINMFLEIVKQSNY